MTLDEAIKHAEKVAEEKENEAQDLEYSKLDWRHEANQCSKCAEEHRQLAEWLKDYKRLLEQEPSRDIKEIAEIMECDADAETKCKMISNILTAKPHYFEDQEPETGHWINYKDEHQCSQCRETVIAEKNAWEEDPYDYCPKCGRRMESESQKSEVEE